LLKGLGVLFCSVYHTNFYSHPNYANDLVDEVYNERKKQIEKQNQKDAGKSSR
jgi:putative NIF3 family GTP cyclohydrolase 1 type 2